MSKLVVNQVQYSGGTALTLPQSGGTTSGEMLKTDGSGNLSFSSGLSTLKSEDGSSVTYTMPATVGSANQLIKTDGSGNLSFTNATATNPMAEGDKDGMVLIGSSGSDFRDNPVSTYNISVPTSMTTNRYDIVAYKIYCHGINANGGGKFWLVPTNQSGTHVNNSSGFGNYRWNHYSYGMRTATGIGGELAQQTTTANAGPLQIGTNWNGSTGGTYDQVYNSGSSQAYYPGWFAEINIYPCERTIALQGWFAQKYGSTWSNWALRYFGSPQTASNSNSGNTYNGDYENTVELPMGWSIYSNGGSLCQGVFQVYAIFKDGVV